MKIFCLLFSLVFSLQSGGDTLKEEIAGYLNKRLTGYDKVEFEIASRPFNPAGGSIRLDTLRETKITGSVAYLPVLVVNKDKKVSQSFVSLRLSLYKKVLVSKKLLPSGSELKAADFELKSVDVAKFRSLPVCDTSLLSGFRAKFALKEGEELLKEKLQPVPVIKKGDSVTAFAVKGNVEISMDAVARQDGCPGEVIRILTPEKKIFRARVIDQFSVYIIE
jgi:flagella basal body P-ring formation protein FlgA